MSGRRVQTLWFGICWSRYHTAHCMQSIKLVIAAMLQKRALRCPTVERQPKNSGSRRGMGYKYFPLVQVRGEGSQEVETVTRHQMGPYAPAFLGSIGTPPNITQNHPNFWRSTQSDLLFPGAGKMNDLFVKFFKDRESIPYLFFMCTSRHQW